MLGIECNNLKEVEIILNHFSEVKGNVINPNVKGLINEIDVSSKEIGYPVVIVKNRNHIEYYFGTYDEEPIEVVSFSEFTLSNTLDEKIKDVEKMFKHYNYLCKPENSFSLNSKVREKMVEKMKVGINNTIGRIELYQNLSTLFLTEPIPREPLKTYLYCDEEDENTHDDLMNDAMNEIIEFIAGHLKDECAFSTSIPIMDAIENIMNDNDKDNIIIVDDNN